GTAHPARQLRARTRQARTERSAEDVMARIVVFMRVTLDGVMQAPARPDEDSRRGFQHGGWAVPYSDSRMAAAAGESMATTGGIILGRRTYEDFYSVWPKRTDNPYTEVLNNAQKYVASRTLIVGQQGDNSTLLNGHAAHTGGGL